MRFPVIVADPPWKFADRMRMSEVRRGSDSQYATMTDDEIAKLDVRSIASDDAVLALWCPSAKIDVGLSVGRAWGFPKLVTLWTWVKRNRRRISDRKRARLLEVMSLQEYEEFAAAGAFAYGMGWTFKGFDEHALIMRRGDRMKPDVYPRNGRECPPLPHSSKPEALQDDLQEMFQRGPWLELFARRNRPLWLCTGLECDGLDVRAALAAIAKAADPRDLVLVA
jgi:N6-adenosine-specific RNA methylase IME4